MVVILALKLVCILLLGLFGGISSVSAQEINRRPKRETSLNVTADFELQMQTCIQEKNISSVKLQHWNNIFECFLDWKDFTNFTFPEGFELCSNASNTP